jgi:hypothetical protein
MSEKTPQELDQELASRLSSERAHTIETILLIAEVDRRKTFVELGFSSTWDYLRRIHHQSDTMIHYRLGCARAVNRFPQVLQPLRDGSLCMTTLAELMRAMTEENCDELLGRALGKSSREAKRIVAAQNPKHVPQREVTRSLVAPQVIGPLEAAPNEQPRLGPAAEQPVRTEILTESFARVSFTTDREYEELLKEVRSALSHKMPGAALLDLIKESFREVVKQSKKRKGIVDKPRAERVGRDGKISDSVKRFVEKRDHGKCQWPSDDGGICGSTHRVQFHHIQDRGKGGEGTPDNVIQLCQQHNLLAAEIAWGRPQIERFRTRQREKAPQELQSRLDFNSPH